MWNESLRKISYYTPLYTDFSNRFSPSCGSIVTEIVFMTDAPKFAVGDILLDIEDGDLAEVVREGVIVWLTLNGRKPLKRNETRIDKVYNGHNRFRKLTKLEKALK